MAISVLVCTNAWAGSDSAGQATVISSLDYTNTTDNSTFTSNELADICNMAGSIWYQYTPTVNEKVIASSNGDSTELAIYAANSPPVNAFDSICQDDDNFHDAFSQTGRGEMTYADLISGTTYFIVAGSSSSDTRGDIQVQLRAADAAITPADHLADAPVVSAFPFYQLVDNTGFGNETDEVICDVGENSFWYELTPENDGNFIVRASGTDTEVSVFTGVNHPLTETYVDICDLNNFGDEYSEVFSMEVDAGVTYYIQISDDNVNDEGLHAISIIQEFDVYPDHTPGKLVGRFEFQDNFTNKIPWGNDLIQVGAGTFTNANVNGEQCRVYSFTADSENDENNGLSLNIAGLFSGDAYTFVAMIQLSEVDDYVRLLRTNGDNDEGFYAYESELLFYDYDHGDYLAPYVPRWLMVDTWVHIALTYDNSGLLTAYVNGKVAFMVDDSYEEWARITEDTIHFFSDDSDENASGSVANILLYDQALTDAQIAGLKFRCGYNGLPVCDTNILSNVSHTGLNAYEACTDLILGENVKAQGGYIKYNAGVSILFSPGFEAQKGGIVEVRVCGNTLCSAGDTPLIPSCHSCVNDICAIDPTCCSEKWSQACVDKVKTVCELICDDEM